MPEESVMRQKRIGVLVFTVVLVEATVGRELINERDEAESR